MPGVKQAIRQGRSEGVGTVLRKGISFTYVNYLREYVLARRRLVYNGVVVDKCRRYADDLYYAEQNPLQFRDKPRYETELCWQLRQHVRSGDDVVIVGGGWGVTTVIAARHAGSQGSVRTFEGAGGEVDHTRHAADRNGVADRVTVLHSVVEEPRSLRGPTDGADVMSPDALPECDVLELDCEGVEISVLEEMTVRPRVLLIESHEFLGTPPDEVRQTVSEQGYLIVAESVAEQWSPAREFCEESGINVLTAVRKEADHASR